MTLETEIERLLGSLLDHSSALYQRAMGPPHLFADVLTARNISNRKSYDDSNSRADLIILDKLGHISVNPSKKENTFFLRNSYVFTKEKNPRIDSGVVVNWSDASIEAFLLRLVVAAKQELSRSLADYTTGLPISEEERVSAIQRNKDHVFFLVGDRGVGKTFFLNHVLSTKTAYLDSEKVIWVRVNLTTNRGFDSDIFGWIHAQIAKIVLRYYDNESDYSERLSADRLPFYRHLAEWIRNLDLRADDRSIYVNQLQSMYQSFVKRGNDLDVSPPLCNIVICREIFRFARANGFSFIVILDGYDRLDHDVANRERFQTITAQIQELCSSNAATGASYVLAVRSTTFAWMKYIQPFHHYFDSNVCIVGAPEIEEVVSRRLAAISEWIEQKGVGSPEGELGFQVLSIARDFASSVTDRTNRSSWEDLSLFQATNVRGKLQALKLWFQEYCQKRTGRGYRILELMVTAGFIYPPIIYRYYVDGSKMMAVLNTASAFYDSRFLPNVFRVPMCCDQDGRMTSSFASDYYAKTKPLLQGLRVLQLLDYWRAVAGDYGYRLEMGQVAKLCEELFGYEKKITLALIAEFEAFDIVSIERQHETYEESPHDNVELLPNGEFVLKHAIFDVAYLNLCAMRVPLSVEFQRLQMIMPAALDLAGDNTNYRTALTRWIVGKICNASVLMALLVGANHEEEHRFSSVRAPGTVGHKGFTEQFVTAGDFMRVFRIFDQCDRQMARDIKTIVGQRLFRGEAALLDEVVRSLRDVHRRCGIRVS